MRICKGIDITSQTLGDGVPTSLGLVVVHYLPQRNMATKRKAHSRLLLQYISCYKCRSAKIYMYRMRQVPSGGYACTICSQQRLP
jgi:hypothetical protein